MCFDVSEVVLSGRARALLQLIRERSPSKSGLGRPQYSKENEHESSLERGEFLCCSSNFGVPRNHWSEHWSRLREVTPRCYGFDRVPLRQATHHTANSCSQEDHALALPLLCNETSWTDPLIWFQCLFLSSCSISPLLSSKPLGSTSCLLLSVPHLHFGQIWTLDTWRLILGMV